MPEIVIPDLSHPLRLEQLRKALCDVVGLCQIANLIDAYILKIVFDVTASAQAAVLLLHCSRDTYLILCFYYTRTGSKLEDLCRTFFVIKLSPSLMP